MMEGRIPENVQNRSVFREIKNKRNDVITGASFGKDCAVLNYKEESEGAACSQGEGLLGAKIALISACNSLWAAGFEPAHAILSITLSEDFEESNLKILMETLEKAASGFGVDIVGVNTVVSGLVKSGCIVSATALGKKTDFEPKTAKSGDCIVASKWIGIEGSLILSQLKKSELEDRFKKSFLSYFEGYEDYLSVEKEAKKAISFGVVSMKSVSERGIFGALWDLAGINGCGLKADIREIPVRQEVIEICNYLDINPYEMKSSGMLLMVCKDGEELVKQLEEIGINASVIGEFTSDNDKVIINGEEKRFLDKIKQDSIYKIY